MGPASLVECANCGIDAVTRCVGCMGAPEYRPGDSISTVYCSRGCQKKHWSSHKAYCRPMQQRKKLFRAARVLKAALLTYKEVVYDIDLTKIEFKAGVLHLYQSQRPISPRARGGLFPSHLTTDIESKEAALAINQCTTAMALLGRLTWKLLQGVASTIEILDVRIGKPRVPSKLVPSPDSEGLPHTVFKVELPFADEAWIIDRTGCQYGFRDVLIPFKKYIADNACRFLNKPTTYDATETNDLDFFSTLSYDWHPAQLEDQKLERQARLYFAIFVDTKVSKDMLIGSDAVFQDRCDSFVRELKSHMLSLAN